MDNQAEITSRGVNANAVRTFRASEWYQVRLESGFAKSMESRLLSKHREGLEISKLSRALEVIGIIEDSTGFASTYPNEAPFEMHDAMKTAILLEPMILEENAPKRKRRRGNDTAYNRGLVDDLATVALQDSSEMTREFIAGLAYIESTREFDAIAGNWRKELLMNCSRDFDPDDPAERQLLKLVDSPENTQGFDLLHIKNMLADALTKDTTVVQDIMMHYRAPLSDIFSNIQAIKELDIEGLLIKAATMVVDLQNPEHTNSKQAAAWCASQEILSFYAPMLEIAGFTKMADQCYSAANKYLYHRNPELIDSAQHVYDKIAYEWEEFIPQLMSHIQKQGVFSVDGFRIKSVGSIANKLNAYNNTGVIPDVGAIMLTTDQELRSSSDIQGAIAAAIELLEYNMRCHISNPNEELAAIDIKWGDNQEIRGSMQIFNKVYKVDLQPKTADEFEGINISVITDYGNTLEVQIHDSRTANSRNGIASHSFYNIGKNGAGELTNQRRNLRRLHSNLKGLRVKTPFSKECQVAEKEFNSALGKYNRLKQDLLDEINITIKPRVKKLGFKQIHPYVNPQVVKALLKEPSLSKEMKTLLNNPEIMSSMNWIPDEP